MLHINEWTNEIFTRLDGHHHGCMKWVNCLHVCFHCVDNSSHHLKKKWKSKIKQQKGSNSNYNYKHTIGINEWNPLGHHDDDVKEIFGYEKKLNKFIKFLTEISIFGQNLRAYFFH